MIRLKSTNRCSSDSKGIKTLLVDLISPVRSDCGRLGRGSGMAFVR